MFGFKIGIYVLIGLSIVLMICVFGMMIYTTFDVLNLRSHECENITVQNTNYVSTNGFSITVNGTKLAVLNTADENVVRKWGGMEPGDVISAKLGKTAVEFC